MSIRTLASTMTLAATSALAAQSSASSDTARYLVLFSDRVAGYHKEWSDAGSGAADIWSEFEFNDRGRGPHLRQHIRLDARGKPTAMDIVGHGYFKDTVVERFALRGDSALWTNTAEGTGSARAGGRFYVSVNGTLSESALLLRALLASPQKRVPLLPAGEATVERILELPVDLQGQPRRLILYGVSGLSFSPVLFWTDENAARLASVSAWSSVVPEGWQSAVPKMVEVQEAWRSKRYEQLARQLGQKPRGPVVIRGARLFVAESGTIRSGTTVVISGNRIRSVGADGRVPIPVDARVIEGAGMTLVPGLWDMHVHISPGDDGLLHIAAGVTSARDMGNDTVGTLVLRQKFADGSLIGPRLDLAGLIDAPGPYQVPTGVLAADEGAARRAVDWFATHGYAQIKVYSSVRPELVPAIINAAHARGLRVSGHVPAYMTAEQVVKLGFDEVQHANFLLLNFIDTVRDTRSMARFTALPLHAPDLDFSSERVRDFIRLFKERGTVIDPTLVTFEPMFTQRPGHVDPSAAAIVERMPPQVRRSFYSGGLPVPNGMDARYRAAHTAMLRMVKAMYDAGVPIVAGTDATPGFMLHRELELYVQAGIPARDVLTIATLGAARVMKHDDERGSITPGKLADLVLVEGDPTTRISDIRRTRLVIKDGIIYTPAELYAAMGIAPAP